MPAQYALTAMLLEGKSFKYGVCLPSLCSSKELSELMKVIAPKLRMKFDKVVSTEVLPKKVDELFEQRMRIVMFLFLSLTVISSFVDLTWCGEGSKQPYITFSIFSNGSGLMKLRLSDGTLTSLDGIRVISFLQIAFYHMMYFTRATEFYIAPSWSQGLLDYFCSSLSLGGFLAVETFLLLSGFLLSYQFMKSQEAGPNFNVIRFYLKRWLRLLPPFFMLQWTFAVVGSHIIGPDAPMLRSVVQNYAKNPVMLLFKSQPFSHLWYVAVEFRLSLAAPLLLLGLRRYGFKFFPVLTLGTLASILWHSYMIYTGHIPTHTTRGRCATWLVGIMLGYFVYREKFKIYNPSTFVAVSISTICLTALMSLLYWRGQSSSHRLDDVTGRIMWVFFLIRLLLLLLRGQIPTLAQFLSHPVFQVLSKLTYSAYLWHEPLLHTNLALLRSPPYHNFYLKANLAISIIMFSLGVAVIWCLFIEMPFMNLERIKWKTLCQKQKSQIKYQKLKIEVLK